MFIRYVALVAMTGLAVSAQQVKKAIDVETVGHLYRPEQVKPTDDRIGTLKAPAGFRITKFAEGLGKPRIIAVADDNSVYVTRREPGDVLLLKDADGDGRADGQQTVARREGLHGIAVQGSKVYLATVNEVFTADRKQDGAFGELRQMIGDLPDGGQHPNRTLAIGPDGKLYITVGSTCNECAETSKESATVLQTSLDGSNRTVFASGLRNTIGIDWHPETGQLWGLDHGIDWLGDNQQGEELNQLVEGAKYGWPYVYGKGGFNLQDEPPAGSTHASWAKESREPELLYTAHAAPMQMLFYRGSQFPEEYRNDVFATMRGSWNRKPPSGYEVVRIRFENGKPAKIEPFLTGFLSSGNGNWSIFGRPVGLAVMKDGSLLIGDDTNGVIYRVSYEGQTRSRTSP